MRNGGGEVFLKVEQKKNSRCWRAELRFEYVESEVSQGHLQRTYQPTVDRLVGNVNWAAGHTPVWSSKKRQDLKMQVWNLVV